MNGAPGINSGALIFFQNGRPMRSNRPLIFAACTLLLFMGTLPLAEAYISTLPGRPGNIAWRYGAVGVVAEALALPLVALVLSVALALLLEWRIPMRLLATLGGLGAIAGIVVLPLFLLDALQLRGTLKEELRFPFDMATGSAAIKISAAAVLGWMVAWGAWRAAGRLTRHRPDVSAAVLVGGRRVPGGGESGDAHDANRPGDR
jgi:hypothetical protein